jgi:prepilin-type N-terminal cleavage/methylation domain-containing protein
MKNLRQIKQKTHGFTVIELIIVIAVIGILASIALVVYPGYQQRARDDERKSDVQQIATALGTYAIQKNDFMGVDSDCGKDGDGNGWIGASGTPYAANSIMDCLQDAGVIDEAGIVDPSNCVKDGAGCGTTRVTAYMKATCEKDNSPVTYVFAYLESQPQKVSEVDALCDAGTVDGFDSGSQKWGTNYGMNYYKAVR